MIYGYNTKWTSKSFSGLNDMGNEFLNELQKARRSEEVCEEDYSPPRTCPGMMIRQQLPSDMDYFVGNQAPYYLART